MSDEEAFCFYTRDPYVIKLLKRLKEEQELKKSDARKMMPEGRLKDVLSELDFQLWMIDADIGLPCWIYEDTVSNMVRVFRAGNFEIEPKGNGLKVRVIPSQ